MLFVNQAILLVKVKSGITWERPLSDIVLDSQEQAGLICCAVPVWKFESNQFFGVLSWVKAMREETYFVYKCYARIVLA